MTALRCFEGALVGVGLREEGEREELVGRGWRLMRVWVGLEVRLVFLGRRGRGGGDMIDLDGDG